jgi:hypothetical protein
VVTSLDAPTKPDEARAIAGRVLLVIVALVASVWTLRDIWAPQLSTSETLAGGYFEPRGAAEVAIAAEPELKRNMQPDVDIVDDGSLSVPPGRVLVDIGEDDVDYVVRSIGTETPPFVLVGRVGEREGETTWVEDLRAPQARAGAARLVPFEIQPWAKDAARLAELRDTCSVADEVHVRRRGRELRLAIGTCEFVHTEPEGSLPTVAFLSATGWLRVSSEPRVWHESRQFELAAMLTIVLIDALVIALLASWLGPGPTLVLALVGALLSPWRWGIGVLWWAITSLLALGSGLVRAALALGLRRSVLAFGGVAALAVAVFLSLREPEPRAEFGSDTCLVTGYSTVHGEGLRRQTDRLSDRLATLEGPCAGSTATRGFPAANLWRITEFACSETSEILIFFGGSNDDMLWTPRPHRISLLPAILQISISGEAREARWSSALDRAIASSEADLDAQRDRIGRLATCGPREPETLFYFHDFLVIDLDGMDEGRARLRAARGAAVTAAGATFVDTYAELRSEASVTWFSDFVHLSAIGHARVARLVADRVQGADVLLPSRE